MLVIIDQWISMDILLDIRMTVVKQTPSKYVITGTLGNWKIWKILKEMGLDMGFWGSDPTQVGDWLEPELMGTRVLAGDRNI